MKTTRISKQEIVQRPGDLQSKIYVVRSGLLRSYKIDSKGKEHIYLFAPEGWVIGDACSEDEPCSLFIEALEPSEVLILSKDISREQGNAQSFIKRMKVLQDRILMLMSATALERYEHFLETYPNIVQRVPQRMIASYLGITPEALSKIKSNRLKK
ncbi:MAG: Crp/Fnr family transcriptional regulator [Bacteroidota bacterium]